MCRVCLDGYFIAVVTCCVALMDASCWEIVAISYGAVTWGQLCRCGPTGCHSWLKVFKLI